MLGIDDAVQIEGWRLHRSLAEHHMDLSAMVCLMIEKMADCDRCILGVLFALVVGIAKRFAKEVTIHALKGRFDPGIFFHSGETQVS
jgi:hypothetical protein